MKQEDTKQVILEKALEQFRSPALSALYSARYSARYVDRLTDYHVRIFESLIARGEIRQENPRTLVMMRRWRTISISRLL